MSSGGLDQVAAQAELLTHMPFHGVYYQLGVVAIECKSLLDKLWLRSKFAPGESEGQEYIHDYIANVTPYPLASKLAPIRYRRHVYHGHSRNNNARIPFGVEVTFWLNVIQQEVLFLFNYMVSRSTLRREIRRTFLGVSRL